MSTNRGKHLDFIGGTNNDKRTVTNNDFFGPPNRNILNGSKFFLPHVKALPRHRPEVRQNRKCHSRECGQQTAFNHPSEKIATRYFFILHSGLFTHSCVKFSHV